MKKFILMILLTLLNFDAHAYDNENMHQFINKNAARQSANFVTTMKALGFKGNLPNEILELNIVNNRKIKDWFHEGGKQEDVPDCRSKYHFHDPTKTFDEAGLSNIAIDTWCTNWGDGSSIVWSQHQGNTWSWQKGRVYYYQALSLADPNIREQKFADTFRAVGQVMHLLADAAVPEHVRNDIHILPFFPKQNQLFPQIGSWTYETWCFFNGSQLNTAVDPLGYSITNTSQVAGLVPITNFWDTTFPAGYNMNPTGLAEYTNLNFVSSDTIFKGYTYPVKPSMFSIEPVQAEDGSFTDARVYFRSITSDGINLNHLASTGYLWAELSAVAPDGMDDSRFSLDDKCFAEYASILVPKAVSYTAGLLNYFFRGKINIMQTGRYTFQIANLSDEDISGDLTAFKLFYDDTANNRREIPLGYSDPSGTVSTLAIPARSISTFTATMGEIPVNPGEPGTYTLVFKGRLGNEEGAVIGQAITPHFLTHVDIGGQWDIYEYDLLGNRIVNVTGSLPRGIPYYGGLPSPANPDLIMYYADSGCSEGRSCLYLFTKSTAQPVNLGKFGVFWWSKDGTKIYAQDTYFDILADTWYSQPMSRCDYQVADSSFSSDGTRLASEVRVYNPATQYYTQYDIAFLDNWAITSIVDMNTMSVVPVGSVTCQNYRTDEEYYDAEPDYHPTGPKVAFSSNRHGTFDASYADRIPYNVYLAEGSSVTKLTDSAAGTFGFYQAVWSPDGNRLLLAGTQQDDVSNIYIMPAMLESGEVPTPVTAEGEDHYFPRWMGYLGQ